MIRHIVLLKFAEEADGRSKKENMKIFKEGVEALVGVIPEIITFEVGIDELLSDASYDLSVLSTFESMEALEIYRVHPEHQKMVKFIEKTKESRIVIDYTINQ